MTSPAQERRSSGERTVDLIEWRRTWYLLLAMVLVLCTGAILLRGFTFGAEFTGATQVQLPAVGASGEITVERVDQAFLDAVGRSPQSVRTVDYGNDSRLLIRSDVLRPEEMSALRNTLFERLQPLGPDGRPSPEAISDSAVGATWGDGLTQRTLIALGMVLVVVTMFFWRYFGPRMTLAALSALAYTVLVVAGTYALAGFEVTPAAIVGLLAVVVFSLYNTVVVFDRVRENTRGLLGTNRRTFAEATNLAANQTLPRSIIVAVLVVLPIISLLVVGSGLLGVGGVDTVGLVLLVGIVVGVLATILLATSLLVDLTLRDPAYRQQVERVAQRRDRLAAKKPRPDGADGTDGADGADERAAPESVRREESLAAASGTPTRVGKSRSGGRARGSRRSGRGNRSSGRTGRRPGPERR